MSFPNFVLEVFAVIGGYHAGRTVARWFFRG
jgi:hypothetical protein